MRIEAGTEKFDFRRFLAATWLQGVEIGRPTCGGFPSVINACATDLLHDSKLQLSVSILLYTTYALQRERSTRQKNTVPPFFRYHTESKAYQLYPPLPYIYYSRKQLLDMVWTASLRSLFLRCT